jgi:DNA-binding MarR family transcriptional regulator
VVALLRTADRVRRRLSATIEPSGITLQQYNVLRILRGAGSDGLPTLEVGERMIEQAPGITRLLDRLEKKGLVARGRSSRDRRQVFCRILPAGLRLLEKLDSPVDQADDACLAMLSRAELGRLLRLLEAVGKGNP